MPIVLIICKTPSLGMLILLCPLLVAVIMIAVILLMILKIYYDDSMPPIYDDYIDESGFGRVSTLGSNDPTILEGV